MIENDLPTVGGQSASPSTSSVRILRLGPSDFIRTLAIVDIVCLLVKRVTDLPFVVAESAPSKQATLPTIDAQLCPLTGKEHRGTRIKLGKCCLNERAAGERGFAFVFVFAGLEALAGPSWDDLDVLPAQARLDQRFLEPGTRVASERLATLHVLAAGAVTYNQGT